MVGNSTISRMHEELLLLKDSVLQPRRSHFSPNCNLLLLSLDTKAKPFPPENYIRPPLHSILFDAMLLLRLRKRHALISFQPRVNWSSKDTEVI